MADTTWDDAVQLILDGLCETLVTKQHDYGHENILWGGPEGVLVRAHDKIARIKNLLGRDQAANESLRDSWLDLAGYAVIAMMLMDGTFTRPLACDINTGRQHDDRFRHSDGTWQNHPEETRMAEQPPITEGHVKAWIAQAIAHHMRSAHETETWPKRMYINEL